jgi:hypothetical protein
LLKDNPKIFKDFNPDLQDDIDVSTLAVSIYPSNLKYVSDGLKDNEDVVFSAVTNNTDVFAPNSLIFASDRLRNDVNFIKKCFLTIASNYYKSTINSHYYKATPTTILLKSTGEEFKKQFSTNLFTNKDYVLNLRQREFIQ